jgi:predicted SAM-dependent methyltransferase
MVKLNLGCGKIKQPDEIGLDIRKDCKPDILCDLSKGIPLKSDCADEIYTHHFLEHLEDCGTLIRDIVRVAKKDAKVVVIVPYWSFQCAMFSGHKCTFPPEWFRRICTEKVDIETWFGNEDKPRLLLEEINYHYTKDGLAFCQQLGITPDQGVAYLNNIADEMTVIMKVVK